MHTVSYIANGAKWRCTRSDLVATTLLHRRDTFRVVTHKQYFIYIITCLYVSDLFLYFISHADTLVFD